MMWFIAGVMAGIGLGSAITLLLWRASIRRRYLYDWTCPDEECQVVIRANSMELLVRLAVNHADPIWHRRVE